MRINEQKRKRGWLPIPAFSHREPPFCVAAIYYLFFAPFLAPPFFAAAFFLPPFFAVAIIVHLLSLNFTSYTRYCSVATLVYYRKCYTTYCCIYLLNRFLSTFFFDKKQTKMTKDRPNLESGYQSHFQDCSSIVPIAPRSVSSRGSVR